MQDEVPAISAARRSISGEPARWPRTPRAPAWASMRPVATRVAGVRPSSRAACGRERAEGGADRRRALGQGGAGAEVGEPGRFEEVRRPAAGEIAPLAGEGALGARRRAGRLPGEEVGEVERHAEPRPARAEVALQPHELRDLHLGRQRAAGVGDGGVAGGGRLGRLGGGAVVEPEDGVPAVLAREGGGDRTPRGIAEDERAGGVEGEARHRLGRGGGIGAGGAEGGAGGLPDLPESCSACTASGAWVSIGRSARPSRRPAASKMPARALPVPMSTAATRRMSAARGANGCPRQERGARACPR